MASYILIPNPLASDNYNGFIKFPNGEEHPISIICSLDHKTLKIKDTSQWYTTPSLSSLLYEYQSLLSQRLVHSASVDEFMQELLNVINRVIANSETIQESRVFPPLVYSHLLKELEKVGWDKVDVVDSSLSHFKVNMTDKKHRIHAVHITIPDDFPDGPPSFQLHFPESISIDWKWPDEDLKLFVDKCQNKLVSFQDFWDVMDDLDQHCHILEPIPTTRDSSFRRIALGRFCAIQLQIDIKQPHSLPDCRFFGSDTVIGPLKKKLNTRLHLWDDVNGVRKNLEVLLEMNFPKKQEGDVEEDNYKSECGICYSDHLGSALPDQLCCNPKCNRPFHHLCLYEWLRSNPSTRQSFGTLFGVCPYCSQPITTTLYTRTS